MGAGSPKMCPINWGKNHPGDMAKLADALDLGSSGATRASSSLVISTKNIENAPLILPKYRVELRGIFYMKRT